MTLQLETQRHHYQLEPHRCHQRWPMSHVPCAANRLEVCSHMESNAKPQIKHSVAGHAGPGMPPTALRWSGFRSPADPAPAIAGRAPHQAGTGLRSWELLRTCCACQAARRCAQRAQAPA
jgi:hypothetical protein